MAENMFVASRYQEEREMQHDVRNATDKIEAWKVHILRAIHQDMAKEDVLQSMTSNQALIIMDWAMKFLPMKFRETQGEWFGKKGRSWHVTAVITKVKDDFEVHNNTVVQLFCPVFVVSECMMSK